MPCAEVATLADSTAALDALRRTETPAVQRLADECAGRPRLKPLAQDLCRLADRLNGAIAGIMVPECNGDGKETPFGDVEVLSGPRAKRATLNIWARRCVSALVAYPEPVGEAYCLERMRKTFDAVKGGLDTDG
jgi:hypothetical protein